MSEENTNSENNENPMTSTPETHTSAQAHHHTSAPAKVNDSETFTIRKDKLWMYSTFVLAAIVVIGGFFAFSDGGTPTGAAVAPTPTAPTQGAGTVPTTLTVSDEDNTKGDPDAKVKIYEFSDYECPFCGRFYSDTLSQLEAAYVDTGKVQLIFKDFPLSFHQNAQKAAEASECAAEQGKFWEMHDKLFENQQALSIASYKQWAGELGLNVGEFSSCLDSGRTAEKVQSDFVEGQGAGIRGTPGFVIVDADGQARVVSGAQPFSAFDSALKAAGA